MAVNTWLQPVQCTLLVLLEFVSMTVLALTVGLSLFFLEPGSAEALAGGEEGLVRGWWCMYGTTE